MAQDTLGKIRKLLAMAEADGLTDEARETYNAKARDLIAQYGIDEALLAASTPGASPAVTDRIIVTEAPYSRDKAGLLGYIARALDCRIIDLGTREGASRRRIFGTPADLERVDVLFTSLLVQQALGLAIVTPPKGENPRAYRRSWMAGFASAVYHRLDAAEKAARASRAAEQDGNGEQAGPSVALVLASKAQHVDAAVATAYPKLRKGRARTLSGSGGRSGYQAGEKADLGGPRVTGARRTALAG